MINAVYVLASDSIGPLVLLLFLGPIVLGLLCLLVLRLRRSTGTTRIGGRRRTGLLLGLVPTVIGCSFSSC